MIKGKFFYWCSSEAYITGQVVDLADGYALTQLDSKPVALKLVSLEQIADEEGDFTWRFFDTLEQMIDFVELCEAPGDNKPVRLVPKDGKPMQ